MGLKCKKNFFIKTIADSSITCISKVIPRLNNIMQTLIIEKIKLYIIFLKYIFPLTTSPTVNLVIYLPLPTPHSGHAWYLMKWVYFLLHLSFVRQNELFVIIYNTKEHMINAIIKYIIDYVLRTHT